MTPEDLCAALVKSVALGRSDAVRDVTPLAGGVASDIFSFRLAERTYCAKFALARLRVAAEWLAPVSRNRAEYEWLRFAARICPESGVTLHGHSPELNGFVMDYIGGAGVSNWKQALLAGQIEPNGAAAVASQIGRIHAASARPGFEAEAFENHEDFRALRIEPYLLHAAEKHPDLAGPLNALADRLYRSRAALVHGDLSPKNILFRNGMPILLDAECATMGDPAFDPAFCLNHLALKAIHMPNRREMLLAEALSFESAYLAEVDWEDRTDLRARILELLPALMLARVEGKSPVEYLDAANRARVRDLARRLLLSAPATLQEVAAAIGNQGEPHD